MKRYPKIPRYDHNAIPKELFSAPDLSIIEKFDGSSFRFTVYDERYEDLYSSHVTELEPEHRDIVFGTRSSIIGTDSDPLESIDGALHRAVRCLQQTINIDTVLDHHEEYQSPFTVYAENMVYTNIDYGYNEATLPALVGFDVLPHSEIESYTNPGNPYNETFDRFLSTDEAWGVMNSITQEADDKKHRLITATILDQPAPPFDPEAFTIPESTIGSDIRAEGIVIRSDSHPRRAKYVREEVKEEQAKAFGKRPDEVDTTEEYVIASYCTSARIRKEIRKLVIDEGPEFGLHLNDDLHRNVVKDIWIEHAEDLLSLNDPLTPSELYPLAAERCIRELREMKTNAELNNVDPLDVWAYLHDTDQ